MNWKTSLLLLMLLLLTPALAYAGGGGFAVPATPINGSSAEIAQQRTVQDYGSGGEAVTEVVNGSVEEVPVSEQTRQENVPVSIVETDSQQESEDVNYAVTQEALEEAEAVPLGESPVYESGVAQANVAEEVAPETSVQDGAKEPKETSEPKKGFIQALWGFFTGTGEKAADTESAEQPLSYKPQEDLFAANDSGLETKISEPIGGNDSDKAEKSGGSESFISRIFKKLFR
ncbi:hypothetical protein J4470_01985 [Candidatus Woesearchaeota archaeon]|nr:hypothetical protein [Candidatus Woesearchaeota archaeon]